METKNISVSRFLKEKLEQHQKLNRSFSLRAFAQKLSISPGGLVHILAGNKKLSIERSYEFAKLLKLSDEEKKNFLLIVEYEQTKNSERKIEILELIQRSDSQTLVYDLSLDHFRFLSEWYGLAILECLSSYGSHFTERELASHFGLTLIEVGLMLERLQTLELLERKNGEWKRIKGRVLASSHRPNEAIRNYYEACSQRSVQSYREQTPQEKVSAADVFAFDPEQLEKVRALTDEYLEKLQKLAKKGKNKKTIYQALVNVYRQSNNNKNVRTKNLDQ